MEQGQQQSPITWDQGPAQSGPAPDQSGITWDQGSSAPPVSDSPFAMKDSDSFIAKTGKAIGGTFMGLGEGVAGTLAGATDLLGGKGTTASKELHYLASDAPGQSSGSEHVGQGLESIAEFMMGDSALKGLSLADRLTNVSKIMKFIEKSPALANALKLGINVGKAGTELGPEERALLQKYPILARLAGHGLDAIRQGAVQGTQTLAKTGGDFKEAAKSGATMAGTSAVLGVPFAVGGGLLAKGAEAAGKATDLASQAAGGSTEAELNQKLGSSVQDTLQPKIDEVQAAQNEANQTVEQAGQDVGKIAANAPEHAAITASAQKAVDNAHDALGKAFEGGRDTLVSATKGETIPHEGSPLMQAAKELLGEGKSSEKPLDEAFDQTRPGSDKANERLDKIVDPYGEKELQNSAKELGPDGEPTKAAQEAKDQLAQIAQQKIDKPITLDMEELLDRRKKLNEFIRKTGWTTDEQRADKDIYRDLIKGVDGSIQQLTEQSGNPEAIKTLGQMNADYKTGISRFENPKVKALLQGKDYDNVFKTLGGGAKGVDDVNTFHETIGDDAFQKIADGSLQRMVADSLDKETGEFNFKKFFTDWNNIPAPLRDAKFKGALGRDVIDDAVSKTQNVNKSGVMEDSEQNIKDITKTMKSLMGGETADVSSLLKDPERVQQLAETVGPDAMGELGTSVLQNQLRKAATGANHNLGMVDTGKVLKFIESLKDSPEIVDSLFRPTPERAAAYEQLVKNVQSVNKTKNIVKLGILAPTAAGTASLGILGHSTIAILAAMSAATAEGAAVATGLLDRIVNTPKMWAALKATSAATQSPLASGASVVSKLAASKIARPVTNYLQNALLGTRSNLQ